ncbi:TIGR02710 family CRISPR-associated CARF protein [Deferrisoma camini]|uniref:TIGR02710 family CRISPR-associated CARF protein n=1 Tax=Deferrisoma camini TaxID=1035120 RepID=UPI00046CD67B|nr:TIGR02710 family CRISPR-associated CARF protein [Deferrisoma camini]
MAQGLLVSVGGTAEPVAAAVAEHRPQVVCFFCSERSVEKLGEIRSLVAARGLDYRSRVQMVQDPEDLTRCYADALRAADLLEAEGVSPEAVVVDYTGGTKTMSAALALATVGRGYRFSYVGGDRRNKGGLGVVQTGTERVRTGWSPWRLFAVEEKRLFSGLFNRHLYGSAAEVLERALGHDPEERRLLEGLLQLTRGYQHWDAFRHAQAKECLREGVERIEEWAAYRSDAGYREVGETARANLEFLNRLQQGTRGFRRRHRLQVIDLLANARRRAEVGRHDDAVARLYRALELLGQIAFEEAFGCETGAAPTEKLPETLRETYRERYWSEEKGACQIPLMAAFVALAEAGRPEGLHLRERAEEFKALLYARNHSILAHGFEPVKPDLPRRFEALLRETFGLTDALVFPRMP